MSDTLTLGIAVDAAPAETGAGKVTAAYRAIEQRADAMANAVSRADAAMNRLGSGSAFDRVTRQIAGGASGVDAMAAAMERAERVEKAMQQAMSSMADASAKQTAAINTMNAALEKLLKTRENFNNIPKPKPAVDETEAQALDRITQRMQAAKAAREAQTQATTQQKAAQDALNASIAAGAGGQVSNGGLLASAQAAEKAKASVEALTKARKDDEAASNALVKSADSLVGKYAPLMKAQQQLAADRAALTKLQKEGTLTETEEAAILAGLEGKQRSLDAMQKTLGGSTKAQAAHFQSLKYQINDVVTGLISGQPPMLVFTQQGGQIVQALQGMDISLKTVRASTLLMAGGLGIAAAGLAAAIYGASRFSEEFRSLERSINLTGGAAGVTANQIVGMSDALADGAGVSKSTAREIQGAYVATGKIGGQVLVSLTEQTKNWAVATNQDTDKAAAQLAGMFSDPARAADELVAKYGMLAPAQARLIKNYQDQGKLEQAQKVLMDAITPRIAGAAENVSALAQAWEWASKGVSNFIDAAGRGFAAKGPSVADLKATADKAAKDYAVDPKGTNWVNGALMSTKEIAEYTAQTYAEAFRNAEADAWFAAIKAGDADFQRLQKAVQDFAQSVDPANAATQAFSNRQEQLSAAVKQGAMSQAEATRLLGLYKAQLLDTMSPMQAFAMEAERQGRIIQAQAGVMRDFEAARQAELKKRGLQPGDALPQRVEDTLYDSTMRVAKDKSADQHRTMTEATEDAKLLARATASMSPAAMVAAQGQVAYNQKLRETKDVGLATQAKNDALAKGYAELSGQIGVQVTQLNQQTTAQDRLAAAAGKGEAAMRAATAENNIAAAALRGVGEATARAAENAKELATQKQIHAEFASGIDLEAAATGRLVKAMGEGVAATRDAEIYNKAIVQAMKEVPPTYDEAGVATGEFAQHVDAAAAALARQQDALDSKAFADYEEKLKAQNRQLQLQQKLIGATPSQAARLKVEDDINEMLRAQKLTYDGLSDAEKAVIDRSRERALANAELEQQIARQKDAYDTIANSLEKSFERVGDALVNAFVEGKGSAVDFGNVAKGILSSLLTDLVKMSVVRPFSNAMFGTNYGTIFDLGGGSAAGQGGGGTSTGGLVNFGVSKGLGYLWDKAGSFLGFGGGSAASTLAAGVVPSASVQASQIAALQAVNPGFAASSYVPVAGGVDAAMGANAASGMSLSSLGSIAGGALSLAGAGYSIGGYLGTMTNSKAVGGLAGGAAAGALAGTMAMPGIGTVIGAIIGGIAGMIGTQKATVGKTASADVTINAGGKSATYGNVQADNEGDPAVGKALGTALSGIYSIAAMGGGSLTKNFGIGQTQKDGLYVAGSVPYKKFGDDISGLLRYTLLEQGGLKDGGANTIKALQNSKAKDWEEAAKDIGLGASIDAGITSLTEFDKSLKGVENAAKKAAEANYANAIAEKERADKLGIGAAYADLVTQQIRESFAPVTLTPLKSALAALDGQFAALTDAVHTMGLAISDAEIAAAKAAQAEKLLQSYRDEYDAALRSAQGLSSVDQALAIRTRWNTNWQDDLAAGRSPNDLYAAQMKALFGGIEDLSVLDKAAEALQSLDTVAAGFATARADEVKAQLEQTAATERQAEASRKAAEAANAFASASSSTRSYLLSLMAGTAGGLSATDRYQNAQGEYASASAAIGPQATAEQLARQTEAAKALIEASRAVNGSTTEYFRDLANVSTDLAKSAQITPDDPVVTAINALKASVDGLGGSITVQVSVDAINFVKGEIEQTIRTHVSTAGLTAREVQLANGLLDDVDQSVTVALSPVTGMTSRELQVYQGALSNLDQSITAAVDTSALTGANREIALGQLSDATRTINTALGVFPTMTAEQREFVLGASRDFARTVNGTLGVMPNLSATEQAILLGQSDSFSKTFNAMAGQAPSLSSEQAAILSGTSDSFTRAFNSAVGALPTMTAEQRAVLLGQNGAFTTTFQGIVNALPGMSVEQRAILLGQSDGFSRTFSGLVGALPGMSQEQRSILLGVSDSFTRVYQQAVGVLPGMSYEQRAILTGYTDSFTKTFQSAAAAMPSMSMDQLAILRGQTDDFTKTFIAATNDLTLTADEKAVLQAKSEQISRTITQSVETTETVDISRSIDDKLSKILDEIKAQMVAANTNLGTVNKSVVALASPNNPITVTSLFKGGAGMSFETGGVIPGGVVGNGIWGKDSVMARYAGGGMVNLAGGEGVLTAPATSAIGGAAAVDFINRTKSLPMAPVRPVLLPAANSNRSAGNGSDRLEALVEKLIGEVETLRRENNTMIQKQALMEDAALERQTATLSKAMTTKATNRAA